MKDRDTPDFRVPRRPVDSLILLLRDRDTLTGLGHVRLLTPSTNVLAPARIGAHPACSTSGASARQAMRPAVRHVRFRCSAQTGRTVL